MAPNGAVKAVSVQVAAVRGLGGGEQPLAQPYTTEACQAKKKKLRRETCLNKTNTVWFLCKQPSSLYVRAIAGFDSEACHSPEAASGDRVAKSATLLAMGKSSHLHTLTDSYKSVSFGLRSQQGSTSIPQ